MKSNFLTLDGVVNLHLRLIFVVQTVHGLSLNIFFLVCLSVNSNPSFLQFFF